MDNYMEIDNYTQTILDSCDSITRAELEELILDGYSIEEAVEIYYANGGI